MFGGPSGRVVTRGRDCLPVFSLAARVHGQREWEALCFAIFLCFSVNSRSPPIRHEFLLGKKQKIQTEGKRDPSILFPFSDNNYHRCWQVRIFLDLYRCLCHKYVFTHITMYFLHTWNYTTYKYSAVCFSLRRYLLKMFSGHNK